MLSKKLYSEFKQIKFDYIMENLRSNNNELDIINQNYELNLDKNKTEIKIQEVKHYLSQFFYSIHKNNYLFQQILITIFTLIIQQIFIPFLQGRLDNYLEQYQIILIILIISIILGTSQFISGIEYENLQSEQLSSINIQTFKILNKLKFSNKKYNFENLLSCKKRLDILESFSLNPKQFLIDQIEIIKQQIVIQLNFLEQKQKKEIIEKINPEIQRKLSRMQSSESDRLELKYFIENLKNVQINVIIQQRYKEEDLSIDQYQFINLLKSIEHKYKFIKKTNLITEGDEKLRNFKSIQNVKLKITRKLSNYLNKSGDIHSYFENTLISKLTYQLKLNNEQDTNVDNVIRKLYQESFYTNTIDIKKIYGLIEQTEGVNVISNSIDHQECISSLIVENQNISMHVRQAKDKTSENIGKKILRKHNDLIPENIPWSINLIKDWKRMSIIFKTEKDISLFLNNKKKLFGEDFSKELQFSKERVQIRIYEIKNGFQEIQSDNESGNQRDLKIIQEIQILELDFAFLFECQVNLENLIIYKKVDHILYDFIRAKDEYELVKYKKEKQEWMEGNTRIFLQVMRIIFIFISISSIGISLIIILNDINMRLRTIQHANLKIQVNFIEGFQPNNICYSIDNTNVNCVGYTKINEFVKDSKFYNFKKLLSNGDSLIGIDYKQKFINHNLIDQDNVIINENIFDIKQNNNLICYSNNKNINCFHKYVYPNLLSIQVISTCISANNEFECTGNVEKDMKDIPNELLKGISILSAGIKVNCASKIDLFLCWGLNFSGLLDIPDEFAQGVDLLSAGYYNVCAGHSKLKLVKCWGLDLGNDPKFIENQNLDVNVNDVPDEVKNGADQIIASFYNACAVRVGSLQCWGWNNTGINDIPELLKEDIHILAMNQYQVCVQKGQLKCWGLDQGNITQMPSGLDDMNIKMIKMSDSLICANSDSQFECWGDYKHQFDEFPDYILSGVDVFALGYPFLCVSKNSLITCQGYLLELQDVSLNMSYNWGLPSIQNKISYVHHCGSTICLFKGSLKCYSRSSNNNLNLIETPNDAIQSQNFRTSSNGSTCAISFSGKLVCWNLFNKNNIDLTIPSKFHSDTTHYSIGVEFICASTDELLECWGANFNGMIDIPEPITSQVITLDTGQYATCASTQTSFICWGIYYVQDDQVQVPEVPDHLKDGVDQVNVGQNFACALKTKYLHCFGYNLTGALDFPEQIQNVTIELMSVGENQVCAQTESLLNCWGTVREWSETPKYLEKGRVDYLNSCLSTNCGLYKGDWICWGDQGIPQRLIVTEEFVYEDVVNFNLTDNQDICMKYDGYIECKSNLVEYERYSFGIQVNESFLCMYVSFNRNQICQVDDLFKQKFICFQESKQLIGDILSFNKQEQNGDSKVVKLSCGTNHGCALYQSGEVHCFGGSEEYKEADLTKDMTTDVYDIRAGQYSTCILNSKQIICTGKDIDTHQDKYNLTNLGGFDQILKFN